MPSPMASTTPAPSLWGMILGNGSFPKRPRSRAFQSEGLTPEAASLTRTSPGPGSGVSISPSFSTSRAAPSSS